MEIVKIQNVSSTGEPTELDLLKVEFFLGHLCNFRCSYCIQDCPEDNKSGLGAAVGVYSREFVSDVFQNSKELRLLIRKINRLNRNILLQFIGGEPTQHDLENIIPLLKNLKNVKACMLVTNLSKEPSYFLNLKRIIGETFGLPERDNFLKIVASYHSECISEEVFLRRVAILIRGCFLSGITTVLTPENFDKKFEFRETLKEMTSKEFSPRMGMTLQRYNKSNLPSPVGDSFVDFSPEQIEKYLKEASKRENYLLKTKEGEGIPAQVMRLSDLKLMGYDIDYKKCKCSIGLEQIHIHIDPNKREFYTKPVCKGEYLNKDSLISEVKCVANDCVCRHPIYIEKLD